MPKITAKELLEKAHHSLDTGERVAFGSAEREREREIAVPGKQRELNLIKRCIEKRMGRLTQSKGRSPREKANDSARPMRTMCLT